MTNILVSDLHMGDGDSNDPFMSNKGSFLRFLNTVVMDNRLILVGDVFDLWKTTLPKIINTHEGIVKEIIAKNSILILGNHDTDLYIFKKFFGDRIDYTIKVGEFTIMHGQQLDYALDEKPERVMARMASFLSGWAGPYIPFLSPIEKWLLKGHRINDNYIKKLLGEHPKGKYIIGHSHKPEIVDGWFYNCGSWGIDQTRLSYIEVNEEGTKAELKFFI